jgi:putative oxidoreductase
MKRLLYQVLFGGIAGNALPVDLALAGLRVTTGLLLCLLSRNVLFRPEGWGPPGWFVEHVAALGFPAPLGFAWAALLSEFLGGLLLVGGLLTRPAALLNAVTTGVAAFGHHHHPTGDGLSALAFCIMSTAVAVAGPGRFSLDALARWFRPPHPARVPTA